MARGNYLEISGATRNHQKLSENFRDQRSIIAPLNLAATLVPVGVRLKLVS